jgi:SSS family solute:Na+ symporter
MALAYGSTFISTSAIVGFGGQAANFGMGLLWLTFLNIFLGIFVAFIFFGKQTRAMGHRLGAHTFSELLGRRFNSRFIQGFAGLVIFLFMPLYAAAVMIGGARFIEQYLQQPYAISLFIMAIFVASYVFFGGLKGVIYTDAFQGGLMMVGMLILLVSIYSKVGGITAGHQALTDMKNLVPASLAAKGHLGWTAMPKLGSELWWVLVSTIVMGVGIGVLAQPQLAVRFMTVKSSKELNRAVIVGGIFILLMTGTAFVTGALTNVYFYRTAGKISLAMPEVLEMPATKPAPTTPAAAPAAKAAPVAKQPTTTTPATTAVTPAAPAAGGAPAQPAKEAPKPKPNVDKIIPLFITKAMPKWFSAFFLITLLAAAMSTLSGQFHAIGTAIGRDVFQESLSGGKYKDKTVLINKLGILVGLIVTIYLAYKLPGSIIALATSLFFGLCAVSFLPLYIGTLFWKRFNKSGAIAGLIAGFAAWAFWVLFVHTKESSALGFCQFFFSQPTLAGTSVWGVVDPLIIGLPISFIVSIIVTLVTKKPSDKEIARSFG